MCIIRTAKILTVYKKQSLVTAEKALPKQQQQQKTFKNKHNKTPMIYIYHNVCIKKNKTNQKQTKKISSDHKFFSAHSETLVNSYPLCLYQDSLQ